MKINIFGSHTEAPSRCIFCDLRLSAAPEIIGKTREIFLVPMLKPSTCIFDVVGTS